MRVSHRDTIHPILGDPRSTGLDPRPLQQLGVYTAHRMFLPFVYNTLTPPPTPQFLIKYPMQ